jgi:glutamate racemase
VRIVDSAETTAHAVRDVLDVRGFRRVGVGAGTTRFLATDSQERFARVGSRFLGRALQPTEVELIDL